MEKIRKKDSREKKGQSIKPDRVRSFSCWSVCMVSRVASGEFHGGFSRLLSFHGSPSSGKWHGELAVVSHLSRCYFSRPVSRNYLGVHRKCTIMKLTPFVRVVFYPNESVHRTVSVVTLVTVYYIQNVS